MNPKFQVGDSVKEIGHPDNKAGEVVGYSFDDRGFFYKITSREVDLEKTEIINGFKHCHEDELELVKAKEVEAPASE
jgi:hypothetical protein